MLRTLYSRMALTLVGLFALMALLQVGVQVWSTQHYLLEASQRLNRSLAANLVSQGLVAADGSVQHDALAEVFHTMMVVNPSIEVYLLDPAGQILTYSAPPGRVRSQRVDLDPVRAFLDQPQRLPVLGPDPRSPGERTVFSATPVHDGEQLSGYLYIVLAGERYRSAFDTLRSSYVTRMSAALVVAAAVFVAAAALMLFGLLTRRLRRLAESVAIAPQRDGSGGDEVDRLEQGFRALTQQIQQQLDTIRSADEERRTLVGNLSHDLKTPLASMQGHLETLLLKEAHIGEEERRRYLQVAVANAQRLGRQVAELFDLARLDAPQLTLNRETFLLAELAQDVAQKFAVLAEEKQLALAVDAAPGPSLVHGDIGLLERALDNLLKNAIEHSPGDSRVQLTVHATGGQVLVEVADRGPGLAPEDLPHLFERFYRGGHHRRRDGSGLGLAIVQRIAELHGGAVRAENREDGGARFCLRLPAAESSRG